MASKIKWPRESWRRDALVPYNVPYLARLFFFSRFLLPFHGYSRSVVSERKRDERSKRMKETKYKKRYKMSRITTCWNHSFELVESVLWKIITMKRVVQGRGGGWVSSTVHEQNKKKIKDHANTIFSKSRRIVVKSRISVDNSGSSRVMQNLQITSRSPSLGACNSHNKPLQRHFYRPVYF